MNRRWKQTILMSSLCAAAVTASACTRHTVQVEPIRVEPIHLTLDINVRVDRELDEFFDYKRPVPAEVEPTTPDVQGGA